MSNHSEDLDNLASPKADERPVDTLPVFFDPRMVADAQSFSPSAAKPAKVVESWKALGVPLAFKAFDPATRAQLCLAHSPDFVDGILEGRESNGFGNRLMAVANALPFTTGAMIAAAREAIANRAVAVAPVTCGLIFGLVES